MNTKRKISILALILAVIVSTFFIGNSVIFSADGNSRLSSNQPQLVDGQLYCAEVYAKLNGVTIDEAITRLKLQDFVGPFQGQLENNDKATFAGLWIQHQPEFKIVVAFTHDGENAVKI